MVFVLSVFSCFHGLTSVALLPHTAEVPSKVLLVSSLSVFLSFEPPVMTIAPFPRGTEPHLRAEKDPPEREGLLLDSCARPCARAESGVVSDNNHGHGGDLSSRIIFPSAEDPSSS